MTDQMGYERMAQEALRDLIRLALERVAETGSLPGEHRIYIKFRTQAEGVILPRHLVDQYPDEITIVLKQHFWDLKVERDRFSVGLSFNQQPETLTVPYRAVVQFFDPGVSFILHFPAPPPRLQIQPAKLKASVDSISGVESKGTADVVSLDAFRRK